MCDQASSLNKTLDNNNKTSSKIFVQLKEV